MSLNINVIKDKILSENWFVLRNMTYELTRSDGSVVRHRREVYDRGNGATILLYNRHKQTVVLHRDLDKRQRRRDADRNLRRAAGQRRAGGVRA